MLRPRRVLETGVYVADMGRAVDFYTRVLGLSVMLREERITAFDAGEGTLLLLFLRGGTNEPVQTEGGVIPPHDGNGPAHYAFAVDASELQPWRERLAEAGVPIESEVVWEPGGVSLYFRDPDGHCVELATPGVWANY